MRRARGKTAKRRKIAENYSTLAKIVRFSRTNSIAFERARFTSHSCPNRARALRRARSLWDMYNVTEDADLGYRLARAQCLIAAVAAEVAPIDSIYPNFRDAEGLKRETREGRRDGFTGKMAIHPDQVPVINEIYTPSAEEIGKAQRLVEAFKTAGNAGVISLDGQMYDQPHLKRALRLLARVTK